MCTKYLIIGIFSSVAVVFTSCKEHIGDIDYNMSRRYVYENKLDIPVKVEYHWTDWTGLGQKTHKSKIVDVNAGESHINLFSDLRSYGIIIVDCDSVRFVFDNAKALWYFREKEIDKQGNVFNMDNYIHEEDPNTTSEFYHVYRYKISQEVYNLATEIK